MSLYQSYRPRNFDSLVEQDFVRSALSNALAQGRTVHAYLFHGSRGTGKTTVARIFAKAVNCRSLRADGSPCDECETCLAFNEGRMLDVVEIDAASNNGVEHVREIIERARFQPTLGKYKVYIVDEVHMLSKGAFNALLKTLEEPPEHVKFVLATTDIAKVPETVVSRTQRYDFRRISEGAIISRLYEVARAEKIEAEEAAVRHIAKMARGGMRDALTLFEQFVLDGKVTAEYVERRLGLVGNDFLSALENAVRSADSDELFSRTGELRVRSSDPVKFAEELLSYLRDRIVASGVRSADFPFLSKFFREVSESYARMRSAPDPVSVLEAVLADIAYSGVAREPSAPPTRTSAVSAVRKSESGKSVVVPGDVPATDIPEPPAIPESPMNPPASFGGGGGDSPEFSPSAPHILPEESPKASSQAPQTLPKPDFSVADFVRTIREAKRSAALAEAIKSASKCAFDENGDFVIESSNSLYETQLSKPESQALILDSLEKLTGLSPKISIRSSK